MKMFRMGSALVLLAVLGLGGCATWERKTDQVPGGFVRLAELKRSEYGVGERVQGSATVRVERSMLQKLLPPIFGLQTVSGDQTVTPGLLSVDEKTTGGSAYHSASMASTQLADLLVLLLNQYGLMPGSAGSEAVSQATAAAYFRALEKAPGADFLLEPRVEITTKGSASLFFLMSDDETATVKVSGKPVTIFADGGGAPAAAPSGG
jgi:hypothetical protein